MPRMCGFISTSLDPAKLEDAGLIEKSEHDSWRPAAKMTPEMCGLLRFDKNGVHLKWSAFMEAEIANILTILFFCLPEHTGFRYDYSWTTNSYSPSLEEPYVSVDTQVHVSFQTATLEELRATYQKLVASGDIKPLKE